MIKIFEVGTTDFKTNGLGQLIPLSCLETKKNDLNGWHIDVELDLKYKELIYTNRIVTVLTKEKGEQAFVIDNPQFDKKIKFTANHIVFSAVNYLLDDVRPTNLTASNYLGYINERTDITSPFIVYSNIGGETKTSYFIRTNLLDAVSTAQEVFEGYIDIDNFKISLLSNLNEKADYNLIYGKNIEGVTVNENWNDVVTKILPVGNDGITLPEIYVESDINYGTPYTKVIDFDLTTTDEDGVDIEESAQQEELRQLAIEYISQNEEPLVNYVVKSNVPQDINIGMIVPVKHPLCEINTEIMNYTYNCISKKVITIEFGNYDRSAKAAFNSFKETVTAEVEKIQSASSNFLSVAKSDVAHLMNTSGTEGFIHFKKDDSGVIKEIYAMDTASIDTSKVVMRLNNEGLAGSTNGIDGPYNTAIMANGDIVADRIKTGTLQGVEVVADEGTIAGWSLSSEKGLHASYTRTLPDYTEDDVKMMEQYIMDEIVLTQEQFDRLDINGSGYIKAMDYVLVRNVVLGLLSKTQYFEYEINPETPMEFIKQKMTWDGVVTYSSASVGAMSRETIRDLTERVKTLERGG